MMRSIRRRGRANGKADCFFPNSHSRQKVRARLASDPLSLKRPVAAACVAWSISSHEHGHYPRALVRRVLSGPFLGGSSCFVSEAALYRKRNLPVFSKQRPKRKKGRTQKALLVASLLQTPLLASLMHTPLPRSLDPGISQLPSTIVGSLLIPGLFVSPPLSLSLPPFSSIKLSWRPILSDRLRRLVQFLGSLSLPFCCSY